MAETDPGKLDKVDQEIRINELKEQASELAGGEMFSMESDDAPPEILEAFWQNVVDVERGGWTSAREQLANAGILPPAPEDLSDEQLAPALKGVIDALARFHTYLHNTNHLSDRELYQHIWRESLDEAVPEAMIHSLAGVYVIDMLGSGSDEDMQLYMKYYADEEERESWTREFPDDPMPPSEAPPHDRDRLLPRPPHGM